MAGMDEEEIIKRIGKNISQLRKKAGIKQKDLAYSCGFEKQNMQRIEGGKTNPTIKTLIKIARELGVTLADLIKE